MMSGARGAEAVLSRHVDAAAGALDTAAGSMSLCSLSRAGVAIPGIKYPEGAWSALREVARQARRGDDVVTCAQIARRRWAEDLAQYEARGSGSDWIAYTTGGVDALDRLLAEISQVA